MTLLGRQRFWDRDGRRVCGSYVGYYGNRGGRIEVHNNKQQILILEQTLNEACNLTT